MARAVARRAGPVRPRAQARRGTARAANAAAVPWAPLRVPRDIGELVSTLQSEQVQSVLREPERLQFWAYAATRNAFFTAEAIGTSLTVGGGAEAIRSRLQRVGVATDDDGEILPDGILGLLGTQAALAALDEQNVRDGLYKAPYDMSLAHRQWNPGYLLDKTLRLARVTAETAERRGKEDGGVEMRQTVTEDLSGYPEYYTHNFHFQTDGWMSERSAKAYEFQTETLFQGSQDAMQRQTFVPIANYLRRTGLDPSTLTLAEVAGGTGRLLTFMMDNWPLMRKTFVDLSPYYVAEARSNCEYFVEFATGQDSSCSFAPNTYKQGSTEDLPIESESQDILTNVYLFHELPMEARVNSAKEFFRVVKPGGLCVITDSVQEGDNEDMNAVLPLFPAAYHEPHYMDYTTTDMVALFEAEGFRHVSTSVAHLSKVWAFEKPAEKVVAEVVEPAAEA